jgi:hypothetical protein
MWRIFPGLLFLWPGLSPTADAQRLSASCSLQPTEIFAGESVTATVTANNFNPKHTIAYAWSGTGGQLTGNDRRTAYVDTTNSSPGGYTVTARVSDAKARTNNEATCSASFVVKSPPKNPPTMACTSNPSLLQAGGATTISCSCSSPDGVPVSLGGWTASSGSVSGHGSSADLDTVGASPGSITVGATCTDSRGLVAQASTQVTVESPPPPPPKAAKLSQCDFPNDKKPWRVDNTCKAILDDVGKNLQQNSDSALVIVGNAEPSEKLQDLAAERAVDCKAYLIGGESGQRIDGSRIQVRTGESGTRTVEFWIVPAGAIFEPTGTHPVDERSVKPIQDSAKHF